MKKTLLFTLGTAALLCLGTAGAQAQTLGLVINEAYGGGGNAGSTYTNDFIELYNSGTTSINLTGLALYYASTTGAFSASTSTSFSTLLSGTIAPGGYFLIQEAQGAGGTTSLPTPNLIDDTPIAMGATGFKLTLGLASATPTGPTATDANTIDFLGAGAANQFEGTAAASAPSNTNSVFRTVTGVDTNNNNLDFSVGLPSPTAGVPEPSTYACMALGGIATLMMLRSRRRA